MEQKQQYFYNLIDIYCKVIFMPEINYINENFSKELLEKYNKSPKINLWNDCYIIQNDGVHIYNVVGVNSAIKQMKIKDTKTDEVEVISFEDYFEYRLPLKTPVVYYYKGRELTGDVAQYGGMKVIYLHVDEKSNFNKKRLIIPDWQYVLTFQEANQML